MEGVAVFVNNVRCSVMVQFWSAIHRILWVNLRFVRIKVLLKCVSLLKMRMNGAEVLELIVYSR